MLYLYDDAIADDIKASFDVEPDETPPIRVVSPDAAINLAAQIQGDEIKFPLVVLTREDPFTIDSARTNFTQMHRGQLAVMDKETNYLYYERVIPIKLNYNLTVLATNTADLDEITREFLFKYINMYYLTIKLPYEAERKIRFGVTISPDSDVQNASGTFEYLEGGKLYQSIIPLTCEGCILVSYKAVRLKHISLDHVIPVRHEFLEENLSRLEKGN